MKRLLIALAFLPAAALAQTPAPAPALPKCDAPEHRQFDFWVGQWEAFNPQGQLAGKSVIEPVYDGCGVRENWKSARVSGGSLNMWDRTDNVWKQNWIDSTGARLDFTGGWNGTAMVLTGKDADGVLHRMTFTPNTDGTVRQHGEASKDAGVAWETEYDFVYRPVKAAP